MSDLFDPADPRPLHFLGIGGAGMSALALAARRRGVPVTGCDPDTTAFSDLEAAGAVVESRSDPAHVRGVRAVIVTAAAPIEHPELRAARAAGIPIVYRKVALGHLVNGTTLVALAGTHGKTTTTVMTTLALQAAGLHPSGLAGGRVSAWGGNALLDGDHLFVVEADEYDKAFLTLHPTVAVINNVEADHLECYGSLQSMEAAFAEFAGRAETVLIGNADAGSDRVAAIIGRPVWRFGVDRGDVAAVVNELSPGTTTATVTFPDGSSTRLTLRVPGIHNLRNATAALGVVHALHADIDAAVGALAEFTGVGRRFERVGEAGGVMIVDDYAHHPTELAATLSAARQAFPDRRIVAVFQPHLYSRTRDQATEMGRALANADLAIITDVYGAREQPIVGITGQLVADATTTRRRRTAYLPERGTLGRDVAALVQSGDLLLTMGAGDITRVGPEVLALLAGR